MHIIIGFITALAGLIWALNSLQNAGFDLNSLNPFALMRRRRWAKKLGTKPMHALKESSDAAALLVVSIAKENGEITRDTKLEILSLFENEFGVNRKKSIEIFSSSAYLLEGVSNMSSEVKHVLKLSKEQFEQNHIEKLLKMLTIVSNLDHEPTSGQDEMILAVKKEFNQDKLQGKNW